MIDRSRLQGVNRPGYMPVDPNAVFEEGALLIYGANGWIQSSSVSAAGTRAIAGQNKSNARTGVSIGEQVTLTGTTASNLQHANLVNGSVQVYSGGTVYSATTDYTVNYVNGTIARQANSTIASGATVSVNYSYSMTSQEIELKGMSIDNMFDETASTGKVAVYQDRLVISITNFDPSQNYATGAPIYDNGDGRVTSVQGTNAVQVGICLTGPTASDPYLTFRFIAQ